MPTQVILRNVRLSFPVLDEPQEFKAGDGKPRWSSTFLVDPGSDADKAIRQAINDAAAEEWGQKAQAMVKQCWGQKNQCCYLDGDTKAYDGYAGKWALASHRPARRKGQPVPPPLIIDKDKSPLSPSSGKPYAGCYVNARVQIYCQSGENPGIRATFDVIQFAADGDAFGAGAPSADQFEAITDGATADDLV